MRLYAGMSREFVDHAVHNRIASLLRDAYERVFRHRPSPGEEESWRNSLRAMSQVFQHGGLLDHGVMLEYQLPQNNQRLDCLISGRDRLGRDKAVIVELKQWSRCEAANEPDLVRTFVGKAEREVLHPSAQVGQYCRYLADGHTAFHEGNTPIELTGCAYLHNYEAESEDPLFSSQYSHLLEISPVFDSDDVDPLVEFLNERLEHGEGEPVLRRIEESKYRPSRKLLEHVGEIVDGIPSFTLLDEQKVVFDKIFHLARGGVSSRKKHVFLINGGPGTGKSVIAIQLMAQLSKKEGRNAQYATGSQAFTKTLQRIVGTRAAQQFRYFSSYRTANPSEIDVLICDEAHRLRKTSTNRFTKKIKRSDKPQIQEIIDAAKVAVFFIDDRQVVRPHEVGKPDLIRKVAEANACELHEYSLQAQFRCAGSNAFVNWIDNTLGVRQTANVVWNQREEKNFEFKIFDSPNSLDQAIRQKAEAGFSARMTAGFCWPWSKQLDPGGVLKNDVVIGGFQRPWNARSGVAGLAPGIPREVLWAHDPRGINQVGCIYTAQGFEFDYVGVIWGPDLSYDSSAEAWRGNRAASHDRIVRQSADSFVDLVKNTYRVLLSRGLKGCYVHFMDSGTETFVRNRCEGLGEVVEAVRTVVQMPAATYVVQPRKLPSNLRILPAHKVKPYANAVPVFDIKIAAGHFSGEQVVEAGDIEWVQLPDAFKPQNGQFVAQVIGESMNRRIPNGSWCLFKANPTGSRGGRVVVAQHSSISDADTGARVTVKVYQSDKAGSDEGEWRHTRISLIPDSTDSRFRPIVLTKEQADDLRIVAELVAILG